MQSKKTIRNPFGIFGWPVLLLVIFILGFAPAVQQEKRYKAEMTLTKWAKGDKWIAIAKNALSKSDIPAKDVNMIIDSLSEFQSEYANQINAQLAAEKKIADSLNKVPPKKN